MVGNCSSEHLVSCMASTSTSPRSSQSSTRGSRVRIELTFQVARRKCGDRKGGEAGRSGSSPSIMPSNLRERDVARVMVQDEAQRPGQLCGGAIILGDPDVAARRAM